MELCTKIRQFLDLQKMLMAEIWKIFNPIIDEVGRQDKKFFLSRPVKDTLSAKWLVMHPKERHISLSHYYLVLVIQPAQENGELNLVLASRHENISDEVFLEIYQQNFLAYVEKLELLTIDDVRAILPDRSKEMPEDLEEDEPNEFYELTDRELGRFPLKEINPAVVAKKILTEARRIFKAQKLRLAKK
jgi:hypothetical protein